MPLLDGRAWRVAWAPSAGSLGSRPSACSQPSFATASTCTGPPRERRIPSSRHRVARHHTANARRHGHRLRRKTSSGRGTTRSSARTLTPPGGGRRRGLYARPLAGSRECRSPHANCSLAGGRQERRSALEGGVSRRAPQTRGLDDRQLYRGTQSALSTTLFLWSWRSPGDPCTRQAFTACGLGARSV
jgi:hypothetical protein